MDGGAYRLDYWSMVAMLESVFSLDPAQRDAVTARIKLLRKHRCPRPKGVRKGFVTTYDLQDALKVVVAFALMEGGFATRMAAEIIERSPDQWRAALRSYFAKDDGRGDNRWMTLGGGGLNDLRSPRDRVQIAAIQESASRLLGGRRGRDGPLSAVTVDLYAVVERVLIFSQTHFGTSRSKLKVHIEQLLSEAG